MGKIESYGVPAGTVVVGVDGSPSSRTALGWAIEQATAEHRPLTLACAEAAVTSRDGHAILEHARAVVSRRAPETDVLELLAVGDPRDLLLQLSKHAALVVVGSRGRGPVRSLLLGSVGVAVSRHASCPAVVARPGNPGLVRQGILVGVEGGERSAETLEFAFRQASVHRLPLTVLHTFVDGVSAEPVSRRRRPFLVDERAADVQPERLWLAESLAGMQEKHPDVRTRTQLARGKAAECLLAMAPRMNLLVVGNHVSGPASALPFGSVARTVVEHASCAVAVVPPMRANGAAPTR